MYQSFAGAICDGIECAPILILVYATEYKLHIALVIAILGGLGLAFVKRPGKDTHTI